MILLDIKKMIRKRVLELESDFIKDPGYELCKSFSDEFSVGKVEDFVDIDIFECVKCLYYINNNSSKSPQYCSDLIDSIRDYVDDLDSSDYSYLFDMLFALSHSSECDNIIAYLSEKSEISAKIKFRSIDFNELATLAHNDKSKWENVLDMKKIIKGLRDLQKKCNLAGVLFAIKDDSDVLGNALSLIEVQKNMLEDKSKLEFSMDLLSYSSREKERSKALNCFYREFYKPKAIMGAVNSIRNFVSGIDRDEAKYYKECKREIMGYESSIKMLEGALENPEITNARNIVKGVKSEEIKKAILQLIYEHNLKYYNSLMERYEKLSSSSIGAYISTLAKYDINLTKEEVMKVMFNPIDDFKEILSILSKLGINNNLMVRVLRVTNLLVCKVIKEYMDKGFITIEFLNNNLDLLNEDSSFYKTLNDNIALLNSYNLNPSIFSSKCEVLLIDSTLFKTNLNVLESYGLIKFIRTTSDMSFIGDSFLSEKIDKLIELGYFNLLEQDLGLLNSNNLSRLEVLRVMHFELDSIDDVREVLKTNKFIISDSKIDDYIPNVLPYKGDVKMDIDISSLERFRNDRNSYLIGNTIISSRKVLRLLEEGYDMYSAIFYGVNISDDEYDEIIRSLSNQK